MKVFAGAAIMLAAGLAPAIAQSGGNWTCSAPGLRVGEYVGGDSAYIHLEGFSSGGRYAVTRQGNTATGTTANGTRFTCRRR
jgi:hypothetical protein